MTIDDDRKAQLEDERRRRQRTHERRLKTDPRYAAHCAFVAALPKFEEGMIVRCPTKNPDGTPIAEDDLPGCGSTRVTWDGTECYDCHVCGIFFAPYAANPPHQRERDDE